MSSTSKIHHLLIIGVVWTWGLAKIFLEIYDKYFCLTVQYVTVQYGTDEQIDQIALENLHDDNIHMEFSSASWLGMVKFIDSNI